MDETGDAGEVSFDGDVVMGFIPAGVSIEYKSQIGTKVWLRTAGASASPTNVQLIAEN